MKIDIEKIKQQKSIKELLEFSILSIDKPSGPTSFSVSDFVRERLKEIGVRKTSHFGTLDPKVTGVLPIALNRACKLSGWFMKKNKTYVGIMRLHEDVNDERLRDEVKRFIGKIKQLPPVKSRVKREEREREVYSFNILERDEKDRKNVLFETEVEAGTYIRKLCLHPNIEILTNNGLIKIKDFFSCPSEIYSLNKGKIELRKPSETQELSTKSLIKLKMSSGIEITATPEHKMLVSEKEGYKMKECNELKEGDYLVKSCCFPIKTIDYSVSDLLDDGYLIEGGEIKEDCKKAMIKKFGSIRAMSKAINLDRKVFLLNSKYAISIRHLKLAGIYEKIKNKISKFKTQKGSVIEISRLTRDHFYLLGLIASDGNNTKEKKTTRFTRLKFHNISEDLINTFYNIYKKLFPSIKISKKIMRNNLFELDTSNSLFASIAAKLGVVSPSKHSDILPILYCKNEFIKSFLRGYFDGDGTAYIKKKKSSTTTYSAIRIFSVNCINAKRIHQMLLKIGINSKIYYNKNGIYIVDINSIASKKKFIKEIGTGHTKKLEILRKINKMLDREEVWDDNYIGIHYKEAIRGEKSKLYKMGGNLSRVLKDNIPITKGFYKKCSQIISLPDLDNLVIERIQKLEIVTSSEEKVYDMTIPETHNFLIETGFISSNCNDIGKNIGGAHMLELRRVKAGIFSEQDSEFVNLYDLEKAADAYKNGDESLLRKILIPAEIVSEIMPVVQVRKESVKSLLTGKPIFKEDLAEELKVKEGNIAVFCEDKLIEVARIINEKEIAAKPEFVLN